jgi:transcriptional regulator with PAS, ATPase and Fis domain
MPSDSFAAEAHRIRQRVMDTLLSAFSALSEGLLIVDRDARIVWMNEQYPRHLGFSDPAEAIGKPVEDVIPNSQMRSVVTSGRPIMLDIMEFGSESFVVMRLPVRDETGEIIGGFGVVVFDDPRQLAPSCRASRTCATSSPTPAASWMRPAAPSTPSPASSGPARPASRSRIRPGVPPDPAHRS